VRLLGWIGSEAFLLVACDAFFALPSRVCESNKFMHFFVATKTAYAIMLTQTILYMYRYRILFDCDGDSRYE
jgi:hypothetical protein